MNHDIEEASEDEAECNRNRRHEQGREIDEGYHTVSGCLRGI